MKILTLLIAAFLFATCNVSNKTFSDGASWIPESFNPNSDFLLVETYAVKKENANMEAFLRQNYPGKYEVVDRKTIMDEAGKFADIKKYRYAFVWGSTHVSINGNFHYMDPNGNFYDRAEKKDYPTTKKYNNYGQKSYIPFFNTIIKQRR
ncbi:MAG TPA: hypothetical protein VGQ04_05385 [Chitinophagaceae bacterium]|jgi:hypothetical protein|nr:hypothetical protein [Chitinophagaceae bacterium]